MRLRFLALSLTSSALLLACTGDLLIGAEPVDSGLPSEDGAPVCSAPPCGQIDAGFDAGADAPPAVQPPPDGSLGDATIVPPDATVLSDADASPDGQGLVSVASCAEPGTITKFSIPNVGSNPGGLIVGPDHNFWFYDTGTGSFGRSTPSGIIDEFPSPTYINGVSLAAGADGNVWAASTCYGTALPDSGGFLAPCITQVTASGAAQTFALPVAPAPPRTPVPVGLCRGSSGDFLVPELLAGPRTLTRVDTQGNGALLALPIPEVDAGSDASDLFGLSSCALAPDGNTWLLGYLPSTWVGLMAADGGISAYAIPAALSAGRNLGGVLAIGPDGNAWISGSRSTADGGAGDLSIWRLTAAGQATEFAFVVSLANPSLVSWITAMTVGPDGNLWFTIELDTPTYDDAGASTGTTFYGSWLARMTPTGAVEQFPALVGTSVVAGANGDLWVTMTDPTPTGGTAGFIERIALDAPCLSGK